MKFLAERKIDRLALPITRKCNRSCPECMARDRTGDPYEVSVDGLKWVGKMIGPIGRIEVTGGEPSMHPNFKEISEGLHDWFKCNNIMLLTNGWLFEDSQYLPILLEYDWVYVTHYTDDFVKNHGTETNTEVHDKIQDYLSRQSKTQFWSQTMDFHYPIGKPPYNGVPKPPRCYYYSGKFADSLAYYRGQLYGCCTAWQLPYRGKGITLTEKWRDEIQKIELPCEQCFLTGEADAA